MSKTWLVCGGRDYKDHVTLHNRLIEVMGERGRPYLLIHGAAKGADRLAERWARHMGVHVRAYPAEWKRYGPSAGPIRNKQMLDEGRPNLVIAFPGGRGTADMVKQAQERGVEVVEGVVRVEH